MINQQTDEQNMISKFCRLAMNYYSEREYEIEIFEKKHRNTQVSCDEILKDYTKEGFFYRLINRLLRGGRDPF